MSQNATISVAIPGQRIQMVRLD